MIFSCLVIDFLQPWIETLCQPRCNSQMKGFKGSVNTSALLIQVSVDHEHQHQPMFKKSGFVILILANLTPNKQYQMMIMSFSPLVLAVHSRETRNDSNETRRVSRETRLVSRETRRVSWEGGNLHLSGTVTGCFVPMIFLVELVATVYLPTVVVLITFSILFYWSVDAMMMITMYAWYFRPPDHCMTVRNFMEHWMAQTSMGQSLTWLLKTAMTWRIGCQRYAQFCSSHNFNFQIFCTHASFLPDNHNVVFKGTLIIHYIFFSVHFSHCLLLIHYSTAWKYRPIRSRQNLVFAMCSHFASTASEIL